MEKSEPPTGPQATQATPEASASSNPKEALIPTTDQVTFATEQVPHPNEQQDQETTPIKKRPLRPRDVLGTGDTRTSFPHWAAGTESEWAPAGSPYQPNWNPREFESPTNEYEEGRENLELQEAQSPGFSAQDILPPNQQGLYSQIFEKEPGPYQELRREQERRRKMATEEALRAAMEHMATLAASIKNQLDDRGNRGRDRRDRSRSSSPHSRGENLKLDKFESDDPFKWDIWKKAFIFAAKNNGWDNRRARRFLAGSMKGVAAQLVDHIPVNDDEEEVADWNELLDEYEGAFRPQAASDLAAHNYESATQMPEEKIGNWHARIRKLYLLAKNVKTVKHDPELTKAFMRGLWDHEIRLKLLDCKPTDYKDLLAKANDAQSIVRQRTDMLSWQTTAYAANVAREKAQGGGATGSIAGSMTGFGSVGAITKNTAFHYSEGQLRASPVIDGNKPLQCFACDGPHMKRDCPSLKVAENYRKKVEARREALRKSKVTNKVAGKRVSGKGGRSPPAKRGRGVNSIAAEDEESLDQEDEMDQGNEQSREETSASQ